MSVIHVAANQLTLIMRSKWLAACSFVFVALAFLVTYFTPTGGAGYGGFNRMTASMLNITLFVIPLIALLLGALFLAGEKEDGGLYLLLTYPVSRVSLLLGKFLGFLLALGAVLAGGCGVSFLAAAFINSQADPAVIIKFYWLTFLLAAMFLAVAVFAGIWAKTRLQALGASLAVWAFTVVFYEFLIMGVSLFLSNEWVVSFLTLSVFLNPAELIRVWIILMLDGGSVFGPAFYDWSRWANSFEGMFFFSAAAVLGVFLPLAAAH
ncbi:MAG: ABC transporter permease subunit, partial [Bacillales bacterium]